MHVHVGFFTAYVILPFRHEPPSTSLLRIKSRTWQSRPVPVYVYSQPSTYSLESYSALPTAAPQHSTFLLSQSRPYRISSSPNGPILSRRRKAPLRTSGAGFPRRNEEQTPTRRKHDLILLSCMRNLSSSSVLLFYSSCIDHYPKPSSTPIFPSIRQYAQPHLRSGRAPSPS